MRASTLWSHRVLRGTVTSVAAVALIAVGVSAAATSGTTARGPGYPPPKGIYAPFTNCPLKNPIMHESVYLDLCIAGEATSGSITIGTITTPVTQPVNVQFGAAPPPGNVIGSDNFNYPIPTPSPLAGQSAILSTKADLIPGSLTSILGCPSSNATVQSICQQAAANPADNQVYALATEAGPVTQFNIFTWQQPVKFQLINPLLGNSCTIGTNDSPVVLHPQLSVSPGGGLFEEVDPAPTVHPDTAVIGISGAVASDTTFSAPGVIGCGPGGVNNQFVDEALNAGAGLPAASGNSLTLGGTFLLADNYAASDSSLPQPQDGAANLLAAFKASTSGEHSVKHEITMSQAQSVLRRGG
jgi:hypothetical protein